MPRLTNLGLWGNNIGSRGALALAASPHLDGLKRLDLSLNPLGPNQKGGGALAALKKRFGDRASCEREARS
jgi:hypothetical protein